MNRAIPLVFSLAVASCIFLACDTSAPTVIPIQQSAPPPEPASIQLIDPPGSPAQASKRAYVPLEIQNVSPNRAYAGLHTTVLITGKGFKPDAKVMFDGVPSSDVKFISDLALTADVPTLPIGTSAPVFVIQSGDPAGPNDGGGDADTNGNRIAAATWVGTFSFLKPPFDNGMDSDNDGLTDVQELVGYPILIDLTGFGLNSDFLFGFTATSDPMVADTDGDGLSDFEEFLAKSNPNDRDTDDDGLWDSEEVNRWGTSPASVDTDGDARSADPSSGLSTLPPNAKLFDGQELYTVAQLKLAANLRGAIKPDATSPSLDDTDGDSVRDGDEEGNRSPLLANLPQLKFEIVDDVDMRLDVEYAEEEGQSTAYETSFSTSKSSSQSQSQSSTVSASVTVGTEIGFGPLDFGGLSVEVSAGYEEGWESSSESSVASEQTSSMVQENSRAKTETAASGSMTAGLLISNIGDISVKVSNLGYTARKWQPNNNSNPQDSSTGSYKSFAVLKPEIGDGLTLAPGQTSGVVLAQATGINPDRMKEFLAQPESLQLSPTSFELEDSRGINFAFLEEVTRVRTARISIDYGNGHFEEYRVATNVNHNPNGSLAGLTLGDALDRTVGVGNWETRQPVGGCISTTPITIINKGFEAPDCPNTCALTGWVASGAFTIAQLYNGAPAAMEGDQWGLLTAGGYAQQVVDVLSPTLANYNYSFWGARPSNVASAQVSIELWRGNPLSGGTLMNNQVQGLNIAPTLHTGQLTIVGGFGGQPLYLRIRNSGSNNVMIDDFKLTGPVSKPVLWRIRDISSETDSTPRFWTVMTSGDTRSATSSISNEVIQAGETVLIALTKDEDGDGLYAAQEQQYGTSDTAQDSDGDGLKDGEEAARRYINTSNCTISEGGWNVTVTQRDGTTTTRRVYSDPRLVDTDGDGVNDNIEKQRGTDPTLRDTDSDGLPDSTDPYPTQQATILFVRANAPANGNGLSWANAYNNLQTALTNARTRNADALANNDVSEIWVAAGVYTGPFTASSNISIYGGFAGGETKLAQRNYNGVTNGCVLTSGSPIFAINNAPSTANVQLDGFLFDSGNDGGIFIANATNIQLRNCFFFNNTGTTNSGAALHANNVTALEIADCVFSNNRATGVATGGAALLVNCTAPTIRRSTFIGNRMNWTSTTPNQDAGGGALDVRSTTNFNIVDCTFDQNLLDASQGTLVTTQKLHGGGVRIHSSTGTIERTEIRGNRVSNAPIAHFWFHVRAGGGLAIVNQSKVNLINCLLTGNQALSFGGGAYVEEASQARFTNCTIAANILTTTTGVWTCGDWEFLDSAAMGGGIGVRGTVALANCVLWGNLGDDYYIKQRSNTPNQGWQYMREAGQVATSLTITGGTSPCLTAMGSVTIDNCDIQTFDQGVTFPGVIRGLGNLAADPQFAGAGVGNYRLGGGSPCVDAGNNVVDINMLLPGFQALPATDLDGKARITDGNGDGKPKVDMGAYEVQGSN